MRGEGVRQAIVEGKRKISQEEAIALSGFFGVDASLFV
jgi:plasmid maintenance system antidote protein VapI